MRFELRRENLCTERGWSPCEFFFFSTPLYACINGLVRLSQGEDNYIH